MKKSNDLKINVMMMGGRRCGKTSVLAAMQGCFDDTFSKSDIIINSDDDETIDVMDEKRQEIRDFYAYHLLDNGFTPDANPTHEENEYCFSVGIKGKKGCINIEFYDFPGEWIERDNKENRDSVKRHLKKSDVIIITIDTPHLMEEDKKYHAKKNRSHLIAQYFKKNFELNKSPHKMVLFVPLKCEKYKDNIDQVTNAIRNDEDYKVLIDYLTNGSYKKYIEVAILPIYTMGTLRFNRFDRNFDNGTFEIIEEKGVPKTPIYEFTGKKQEPLYCDQPIIYTIAYVLRMAQLKNIEDRKGFKNNIVYTIKEKFFKFASADDFLKKQEEIKKTLKTSDDGFCIINDPLKFKGGK